LLSFRRSLSKAVTSIFKASLFQTVVEAGMVASFKSADVGFEFQVTESGFQSVVRIGILLIYRAL
jgi:hypothetical protein